MITNFNTPITIQVKGRLLTVNNLVMGILNATPDSFYSNSRAQTVAEALEKAGQMLAESVDILDIGAYSSRPGADAISADEELERLIPVIEGIVKAFPQVIISVDTFRSAIAVEAIKAGAALVNDISGGALDPDMFATVAKLQVPYILMHMRGTPQTMTKLTGYDNIALELLQYFNEKVEMLKALGVKDIIIDPGFGFAKTSAESFELLNRLGELKIAGLPILVGFSRKSMVYKTLGITAEEALNGTSVLNALALTKGANILRVHDVKAARECLELFNKMIQTS